MWDVLMSTCKLKMNVWLLICELLFYCQQSYVFDCLPVITHIKCIRLKYKFDKTIEQ